MYFFATNRLPVLGLGLALALSSNASTLVLAASQKIHHDLDLTLDLAASRLEAVDHIRVSGHSTLAIKLAPGLDLEEASIDGAALLPVEQDGVLWIELPEGETSAVTLAYGGVLERGDSRGGLSPLLGEEGGFLPYGLGWLANGGAENDWVTYELTVTTPDPYQAVATGKLTEEAREDGQYRATFASSDPTEPPSVFAGAFQIDERDHDGIRLRTYFPADQQQLADVYLDQAAGYLDLFEDRIGDYPYDGFAMIAAPLPVGLGFPGLTYISSQILRMPFMQTRSLAHEILHNWWGNGVFIDQSEGNWAEGLTTYMADYALAKAEGSAKAGEMRVGWLRDFAALPEERDQPLTAFRSKGHDADQVIGYNKVAMVLHMLEQEIGEEAFEAGLKKFWTTHRFESAAWSDLRASFETESGRSLDRFFEPWLTTKGAPELTLDKAEVREVDDGFELDIDLRSDRSDYDLLVPVQIETEAGIERSSLRVQDGGGSMVIKSQEKPISVSIDQQHDLFRYLAQGEAPPILRDVTLDRKALTVIATNGHQNAAEIASDLASRTLDTDIQVVDVDEPTAATSPLMLIGLDGDVAPALAKIGVAAIPEPLKNQGTARSWVARRQDAPPVLVVEAQDEEALSALLRPLPHYSRYSFLTFNGRKVLEKGIWPSSDNPLTKHF